jgi:hypothetical protein
MSPNTTSVGPDRKLYAWPQTFAGSAMADAQLRTLLSTLDPKAGDNLRNALSRDQADRDAIASMLMPYRDQNGQDWAADIIDS